MSIVRKISHFLLFGFILCFPLQEAFSYVQIGSGYKVTLLRPGTNKTWVSLKSKDGSDQIIDVSNLTPKIVTDENGNQYIEYTIGASCGTNSYQSTGDVMADNRASWEQVKEHGRDHSNDPSTLLSGNGAESGLEIGQGEFQIIDKCNGNKVIASGTFDPATGKITYNDGFDPSSANQPGQDIVISQGDTEIPVTVGENGELMDSSGNVIEDMPKASLNDNKALLDKILTFALVRFLGDFFGQCLNSAAEVRYNPKFCSFEISNGDNAISLTEMTELTAGVQYLNLQRNKIYNTLVANQFYVANSLMLSIIDEYSALLTKTKGKYSIDAVQEEFLKQLFNDTNKRKFAIYRGFMNEGKVRKDIETIVGAISDSYRIVYGDGTEATTAGLDGLVGKAISDINPFKKGVNSFISIASQGLKNTNIAQTGKNVMRGIAAMIKDPKKFKESIKTAINGNRVYNFGDVQNEIRAAELTDGILRMAVTTGVGAFAFSINPLLALAVFMGDSVEKHNLDGTNAVNMIKKNLSGLKNISLNPRQADILAKMFKAVAKQMNGIKGRINAALMRSYIKEHVMTQYFDYMNHNMSRGKSVYVLTNEFEAMIPDIYREIIDQHRKAFSQKHFKREYKLFTKANINKIDKGFVWYLKKFVTWNGIIFNYLCNANAVEQVYEDVCHLRSIKKAPYKKQTAVQKMKNFFSKLKHKNQLKNQAPVNAGNKLSVRDYLDLIAYRSKNFSRAVSEEQKYFNSNITLNTINRAKSKIQDLGHYIRYKNLFNAVSDVHNLTDKTIYPELRETTGEITVEDVIIPAFEEKIGTTYPKAANDNKQLSKTAVRTGSESRNAVLVDSENEEDDDIAAPLTENRANKVNSRKKTPTPKVTPLKKQEPTKKRSIKNLFKREPKPVIILQDMDSAKRLLLLYAALGEYMSASARI